MRYTFDLFGITFRGWGAVLVAMSLGSALGKLAAMVTRALIFALAVAAVAKVFPETGGEEGDEGNGEGDNGEDDNGGDDAGFMDPNGDDDDRRLWDIQRTPAPSLRGRGTPSPTTKAPASSRDSDRTDVLSVGFGAVLAGPGEQRPTKRTGATGRAGSLTRAG